jgi:NADH-quinone oxidoreductase subunit L
MNDNIPWFILLCPLISAACILLFATKSASLSKLFSVFAVCASFVGSVIAFITPFSTAPNQISWINLGGAFQVPIGVVVDPLSKVMLLVVTGVGALVHIYSLVYMQDDDAQPRYFGGLSLFMFSMLGIVLADNFVMLFIFWELVGVSSYLLIGHWFQRDAAAAAANKAFICNRLGDFGFMLGILLVWSATGAVGFTAIRENLHALTANPTFLTVAALCIFCGAVGKSAQFPLHVWLPDAMEGPTPVSALIHAATMVAAGVYMLARVYFIIGASPVALEVIAWVGIITSVLAALMATQQDDIKRILAYSTLSQLGYMVSAIGAGAPNAAMFHLFTHAFFKALLFLGAGSVIYAVHHEQNIWRMGGLHTRMPKTFWTFVIGSLALMGCPLLSGFFSKDAVLLAAYQSNIYVFAAAVFTAFLTAFYMTRLIAVAFLGNARTHEAEHGHDGPFAMTAPLLILGFLSIIAGWPFVSGWIFGDAFIERLEEIPTSGGVVPVLATGAFLAGAISGWVLYIGRSQEPLTNGLFGLFGLFKNKFYIDEIYGVIIGGTQDLLAKALRFFDKWIIDGLLVRGSGGCVWGLGFLLRLFQVGNIQGYAFLFGLGVVGLIYLLVFGEHLLR